MIRIFKSTLLAATVLAPMTVHAQDGGAQGAAEAGRSAEIIVTARKREENLQRWGSQPPRRSTGSGSTA